jgi:hypothetical protein
MTNGTPTMTKRAIKAIGQNRPPGFTLTCPCCGEGPDGDSRGVAVTLDLSDLATCHCPSCDEDFAVSTAIKKFSDRLAAWQTVARWIESAAEVLDAASPIE